MANNNLEQVRLTNYATGGQIERERIIKLIETYRDNWERTPSLNFQRKLDEIIQLIKDSAK